MFEHKNGKKTTTTKFSNIQSIQNVNTLTIMIYKPLNTYILRRKNIYMTGYSNDSIVKAMALTVSVTPITYKLKF